MVANMFYIIPPPCIAQGQFAFTWIGNKYTFTCLLLGYKNTPFCHQTKHHTSAQHTAPAEVQTVQHISDVLMQGLYMEHVQQELDAIIELLWHCGWAVNSKKIQGPVVSRFQIPKSLEYSADASL